MTVLAIGGCGIPVDACSATTPERRAAGACHGSYGVRMLDAIHLATALYLTEARARVELATFDERMRAAARALRVPMAF